MGLPGETSESCRYVMVMTRAVGPKTMTHKQHALSVLKGWFLGGRIPQTSGIYLGFDRGNAAVVYSTFYRDVRRVRANRGKKL